MQKTRSSEPAWIPLGYSEHVTLSEKWEMNDKLFKFSPWSRSFTLDRAFRGIKIYGANGSGKTSGFARVIGSSYLDHGFGGLVLCAKGDSDELNNWREMCKEVDRYKSLIHFGPKNKDQKFCFNILEFIRNLTNNKDESQANIVKVLRLIASDLQSTKLSQADSFWDGVTDQYLTHLVTITILLNEKLSFKGLLETFNDIRENGTLLFERLKVASKAQKAIYFFSQEFPKLNEKTSSIIVAAVSSILFKFNMGILAELFGGQGNIDPRWTFSGAVIVVNVPTHEYQEIGSIANMLWKYAFQKACLSRKMKEGFMRPVFLWADEAQEFIHPDDVKFQATARQNRCATVYLTQNIAGLRFGLGSGSQAQDAIKSLESNLLTTIFHQNVDIETNDYASKLLGTKQIKVKTIQSKGPFSSEYSESTSEKEVPKFKSEDFVELKSGGPSNRKIVEAIVYSPGGKLSFDWINLRFRDWLKIRVKQGNYATLRKPSVGKLEPDFETYLKNQKRPKKILLVDDDEKLRGRLQNIFELEKHKVVTAEDGQEAIAFLLKNYDFDLVVSDVDMPNMTGLEMLIEIRKKCIQAPSVFMMSGGDEMNLDEALKLGATKAFPKSKIDDLIKSVNS